MADSVTITANVDDGATINGSTSDGVTITANVVESSIVSANLVTGAKGDDGAPGPAGADGPQGEQGEQGLKGDTGDTGPQGEQGPQGDTGPQGEQGEQGLKGDTGDTGPQGLKGDTGDEGPQGPAGEDGEGVPLGGTTGQVLAKIDATDLNTEWVDQTGGGGTSDHGALTGLADDDHTQYHNDTRGDARYYTQGQVDTQLSGKSDTSHNHDDRYYTETEVDAALDDKADTSSLSTVATTGAYSDLSGTPSIPDALIDLDTTVTGAQLNSLKTKVDGIELGAEVNEIGSADIVDFETSTELNARDTANRSRTNHTGTQAISTVTDLQSTLDAKAPTSSLSTVATSGAYSDLSGTPTIPTNNTELTNGAGYITGYTVTEGDVTAHEGALSITESQVSDLGDYATSTELSTGLGTKADTAHTHTESDITDLGDYATSTELTTGLATKSDTTHNHDADYADISHTHDSRYYTETEVDTALDLKADTTNAMGVVAHGATAGTARPTGYATITWIGSVEPTNAIDDDQWIDTSV